MYSIANTEQQEQKKKQEDILHQARTLRKLYLEGSLGGEVMPEDANPSLPKGDRLNYLYFTLPMALNYQRNSYTLWEAALRTFQDPATQDVYDPVAVIHMLDDELRSKLTKYKIALQPNKHPATWRVLCETIVDHFDGDIRNLFITCSWNIQNILSYMQKTHKKSFPYLSGPKICNYWLYVMGSYTDAPLTGKESLSIAPDTHVIQASLRLGLIQEDQILNSDVQAQVNQAWTQLLANTELSLIDLHTPLWLWSRGGFQLLQTNS
ncbi:hypothetical protein NV379_17020 [Paenibacillus sp. N1-5-1-14]|uniref:hypothetical protein n=1 Tax=Paenibacillus radicibacter TaxID=2972488 RepID=UPI002158D9BE|nr:hypothetical protein [Paenibacillus radicibacter]MCR8644357.1 hypothetical protein [Paenibacillus radicibacter]